MNTLAWILGVLTVAVFGGAGVLAVLLEVTVTTAGDRHSCPGPLLTVLGQEPPYVVREEAGNARRNCAEAGARYLAIAAGLCLLGVVLLVLLAALLVARASSPASLSNYGDENRTGGRAGTDWGAVILAAIMISVAGILAGVALVGEDGVGISSKDRSNDDRRSEASGEGTDVSGEPDPAGPPFSWEVQQDFAVAGLIAGWDLATDAETGRCEVLLQIMREISSGSGVYSRAEAVAAASANGGLFGTIRNATGGNPEAMDAVQYCIDYFVGKRY